MLEIFGNLSYINKTTDLFRMQKLVPMRLGLDKFNCTSLTQQ
jgi:hypothetical protein